jgi:TetR/AcrR family transcriptional regulator, mexJK operon transcriptional repressor
MAPLENKKPSSQDAPPEPDPTPATKREAIVAAGAKVFMEQGFGSASMDEVARQAAVSKATIYSHFESKHALFGAIVTGKCQAMIPAIAHGAFDDRPPAEALTAVGRRFLDILLNSEALPLYRVVIAEAARFPELGRAFYESGPNRVADALAAYFARQQARGALDLPDPRLAAEQFFGMVLGHNHLRTLLAIVPGAPADAERDRIVASAVRLFLYGAARR